MVAALDGGILLLKSPWLGMEEHWNSFGGISGVGTELHGAGEQYEGT